MEEVNEKMENLNVEDEAQGGHNHPLEDLSSLLIRQFFKVISDIDDLQQKFKSLEDEVKSLRVEVKSLRVLTTRFEPRTRIASIMKITFGMENFRALYDYTDEYINSQQDQDLVYDFAYDYRAWYQDKGYKMRRLLYQVSKDAAATAQVIFRIQGLNSDDDSDSDEGEKQVEESPNEESKQADLSEVLGSETI
jgi:hypothetical protein